MSRRVDIVHERFTEYAGSEQVVSQLAEEWPAARVYAPIARRDVLPPELAERVTSTGLSRAVRRGGGYAHLLPALPVAMRRLPVRDADVVVASHHAFATQVVHATSAPVVAYVHTPARWIWDPATRAGEAGGVLGSTGLAAFGALYRPVDRRAAARVHTVVANSTAVADRIAEWWGRDAVVVHPPVNTHYYTRDPSVPREDFLLVAGRLVPYKQPVLAIRAAQQAGRRVVVVGDGRLRDEVARAAGPRTRLLGRVSDAQLRDLFRRCAALVMPGVEDFGIVPVEAQACGAPVVAVAAGGALDTVTPGVSGVLVESGPGALDDLTEALRSVHADDFDAGATRQDAERFSRAQFRSHMRSVVDDVR